MPILETLKLSNYYVLEIIQITLEETPLMRKALLLIKPKSIMDLAICLSIIRPAAKDAKKRI